MSSILVPNLSTISPDPIPNPGISTLSVSNLSNSVGVFYIDLQAVDYLSLQVTNNQHSSGAGAFSLQASDDAVTWTPLGLMIPSVSGMSISLSTNATNMINLDHPEYRFLKGLYEASHSGTMDLTVVACLRTSSYIFS